MGRYQFGGKKGQRGEGGREGETLGRANQEGGRRENAASGGKNTWVSHEDETSDFPKSRPFAEGKALNQSRESERSLGYRYR